MSYVTSFTLVFQHVLMVILFEKLHNPVDYFHAFEAFVGHIIT